MSTARLLAEALRLQAAYGWSCLPVTAAKAPPGGMAWKRLQDRAADEGELARMFSLPGVAGLAVVCGRVSGGLVVRDFDAPLAYEVWCEHWPELAAVLPTSKTGRAGGHGRHVFAVVAGVMPACQKLPGGDLKAEGGYCVLPPSLHASGERYAWVIEPNGEIPAVDAVAVFGCQSCENVFVNDSASERVHIRGSEPLMCTRPAELVEAYVPNGPGQRHRKLFYLARALKAALPEGSTPADAEPYLRQWWAQARFVVGTRDYAASAKDFAEAWRRVRSAPGHTLAALAADALAGLPADADAVHKVRALVARLNTYHGGKPFPAACRPLGAALGLSFALVANVLRALVARGELVLVERSRGRGRANVYQLKGGAR